MTTYYLPDVTGTNPDYAQVNIPSYMYQAGQVIGFENSPIFASSLTMYLTDGTAAPLIQNVDWVVNPTDIDQTAMSRAFLENPGFTGQLIKSFTMMSTKALDKQIAMSYQEFYLTVPGRTYDDGTPFEVSVDLIKSLVTGLADVRQQVARVSSPVAPNVAAPALLPFDINKTISGNVVTNELITVNTVAGAKVIRFTAGAFFADSVTLVYNGSPLNPATDYIPIGWSSLTKQSTNTGGIYQYILLNGSFAGTVTATYHAVGGDVQQSDIRSAYDLLVAIQTFLNDSVFVTSDTVVETPAFRAMNARVTFLENQMRNLLTPPSYTDATAGSSVVRPIITTDSNFHWWTIATLYQVAGSSTIVMADQFKGRVFFPNAKVSLSFSIDVNLNQTRNPVTFSTENLIFDPLYTLFGDVSVNAPVYPMLRVVWNQSSAGFSGACLQIGLPLTALSDQMDVEDHSSAESCWLLSKTGQLIIGQTPNPSSPSDNGFLLPDGVSIWSDLSSSSYMVVGVPKYDGGYIVYDGSAYNLSAIATTGSTGTDFNVLLPTYFPISVVKSLIVTLMSADGTIAYDVDIPLPFYNSGNMTGRVSFADSTNSLMSMSATLSQDSQDNIGLSLNVSDIAISTQASSVASMTDIVRYVRAKV